MTFSGRPRHPESFLWPAFALGVLWPNVSFGVHEGTPQEMKFLVLGVVREVASTNSAEAHEDGVESALDLVERTNRVLEQSKLSPPLRLVLGDYSEVASDELVTASGSDLESTQAILGAFDAWRIAEGQDEGIDTRVEPRCSKQVCL